MDEQELKQRSDKFVECLNKYQNFGDWIVPWFWKFLVSSMAVVLVTRHFSFFEDLVVIFVVPVFFGSWLYFMVGKELINFSIKCPRCEKMFFLAFARNFVVDESEKCRECGFTIKEIERSTELRVGKIIRNHRIGVRGRK